MSLTVRQIWFPGLGLSAGLRSCGTVAHKDESTDGSNDAPSNLAMYRVVFGVSAGKNQDTFAPACGKTAGLHGRGVAFTSAEGRPNYSHQVHEAYGHPYIERAISRTSKCRVTAQC